MGPFGLRWQVRRDTALRSGSGRWNFLMQRSRRRWGGQISKFQPPTPRDIPRSQDPTHARGRLMIEDWNFSGAWTLNFGGFKTLPAKVRSQRRNGDVSATPHCSTIYHPLSPVFSPQETRPLCLSRRSDGSSFCVMHSASFRRHDEYGAEICA
jgi:hypothetical protein